MAASSYPLPSFITLYSISEADGTVIAGQEQSGQRSLIKLLAVMSFMTNAAISLHEQPCQAAQPQIPEWAQFWQQPASFNDPVSMHACLRA